jgi:hypothetical protein
MYGTVACGMIGPSGNGGASMPTSKEFRQQAEQCSELAKQAEEFYVKSALTELAEEFKREAEKVKDPVSRT